MALNPLLMRDGRPQMFANEVLMIIYQGTLYLSNARLIFINSDVRHAQSNFALHLNLIERETYYIGYPRVSIIQGYATPYLNYLPSPGNFKFEMLQDPNPIMNGIKNLLNQIRSIQKTNNLNEARSQAFVDPNDPDILYMIDSSKG
jgi:hypothetical protein